MDSIKSIRLHDRTRRATIPRAMIVVDGSPAFSPARLERRLRRVQTGNPGVRALAARFVHFVDVEGPALDERESRILTELLTYGPRIEAAPAEGWFALVVPRLGT